MADITITQDPEFVVLEEQGFISEYVSIKDGRCSPLLTAAEAVAMGFFPRGTKVHWIDKNGFDFQRNQAREVFDPSLQYTVKRCHIGSSSSTYEFDEVPGRWNSVMFEASM
jgi:hypothetical protein